MKGLEYIPGSVGKQTILISGLIHGDEIVGKHVLEFVKEVFSKSAPKSNYLLRFANLEAYKNSVRYIDEDMNRCRENLDDTGKNSYERKRVREFVRYLKEKEISIDYAYDFHSTPSPSPCFAICDEVKRFNHIVGENIPYVIRGLINIVPGMSMLSYLGGSGTACIAFESGDHSSKNTITLAIDIAQTILNNHEGNDELYNKSSSKIIDITGAYYTTNPECKLSKDYKSFDRIKKGETRCIDGNKKYIADVDCCIMIPNSDIYKLAIGGKKTRIAYLG